MPDVRHRVLAQSSPLSGGGPVRRRRVGIVAVPRACVHRAVATSTTTSMDEHASSEASRPIERGKRAENRVPLCCALDLSVACQIHRNIRGPVEHAAVQRVEGGSIFRATASASKPARQRKSRPRQLSVAPAVKRAPLLQQSC